MANIICKLGGGANPVQCRTGGGMAVSTIQRNPSEVFYITESNHMYNMHNRIPLQEMHFVVVLSDVMQARTGINATGYGYCSKIDSDIVDFILIAGWQMIKLRVSGNAVTQRVGVDMTSF